MARSQTERLAEKTVERQFLHDPQFSRIWTFTSWAPARKPTPLPTAMSLSLQIASPREHTISWWTAMVPVTSGHTTCRSTVIPACALKIRVPISYLRLRD